MAQRQASVKASLTAIMALAAFFVAAGSAAAQTDLSAYAKAEAAAAADGTTTRSHGWEVRYGIAGGTGGASIAGAPLERLIGKAESFAVDLFKWKDEASGENRLLGVGEAHGLFAVDPESAAAVVLDYPNLKAISPRAREAKVIESSASRWYVYEDIGINFMGISIGYKLDAETWREALPNGAIGIRSRLTKSHDGKLYAADASWYFRKIQLGGVSYTYIRTWSTSGLRNPGVGVAGVMKLFTAGELRDQVNAVGQLAGKR
ncbi:MAG: hypothetical protein CVV53_00125 [Spirochaetae bacterium HGW-Spirochaetae-9]|nr:MAG: hypothetical protein CVV53_00125 [Spirochaetae bacterium HGW-Spirochaetae-9]